jgi:hypothetical protein
MGKHTMKLENVSSGEITVNMMPKPVTNDLITLNIGYVGVNLKGWFSSCIGGFPIYLRISSKINGHDNGIYKSDYYITTGNGNFGCFISTILHP